MTQYFIQNYLNHMTINDVDQFARNNDIILNKSELDFVFQLIKNDGLSIIKNKDSFDLRQYQSHLSTENYPKIDKLINIYLDKYGHLI